MYYLKILKLLKPLLGRGFYLSQLEMLSLRCIFLGEPYDINYIEKVWQTYLGVKYDGFITFKVDKDNITYNDNTENYKTPLLISIGKINIPTYQLTSNKNVVVNLCNSKGKMCRGFDLLADIENNYNK